MNRAHLSRRHLLRAGAGAMAAAGTLRRAALAYAERRVPLLGSPRWGHAVGDPRGSDITRAYGKAREGRFGRMFKDLPDYNPPDDVLVELAGAMVESRPAMSDVSDSSEGDNLAVPAGFVYLGQFIDHDMTRDTTPLGARKVDPHGITNFDTPFFDLGSIYGGGPRTDPQLYDPASPGRMLLDSHDGVLDLPRQPDGTAIIGDPRDDENLIICQLQIAFLQLHNAFLAEGRSFADAQQQTRWHFQWVIVHDFLPHIVGQELVDSLLLVPPRKGVIQTRNRFYRPRSAQRPMMPI